jgi:competence protein ComEC
MPLSMSSLTSSCEHFLNASGFDRGPWLVVAFAAGIASWFVLGNPWQWSAAIGAGLLLALSGAAIWRETEVPHLRAAYVTLGLMFAAGVAVIWLRSETVGATPYEKPSVQMLQGYVLEREDRPAEDRIRLTMAVRDAETAEARKIRVNVPLDEADAVGYFALSCSVDAACRSDATWRVRLRPSGVVSGAFRHGQFDWRD